MLPVAITAGVLTKVKVEQLKKLTEPVPTTPTVVNSINALGRLEPRGEVIKMSAPTGLQGTSRVEQLLVR